MQSAECRAGGPALAALQRWLQAVITHPAGVETGIESDEARREVNISPASVESVILPSSRQSSLERLAVYGNAYYLRLLECLRELFPCLTGALGRETFDQFAAAYLARHPPTSYTLQRLADRFAEFLAQTQPAEDAPWAGFVVELARLETAIEQVFDGPGPESDPWNEGPKPEQDDVIPAAQWTAEGLTPQTRLVPTPGLTLLEFRWPVSSYYTAWKRGDERAWPQPSPQHVALLRRDYVVRRHELPAIGYELLRSLVQGTPIGEAVAQTASGAGRDQLDPEQVRAWMTQWSGQRFFAGILPA